MAVERRQNHRTGGGLAWVDGGSRVPSPVLTPTQTALLTRRTDPWFGAALLAATLGLYGVFWLHSIVKELNRRGATKTTPRVAVWSLFMPVYNVVWSVLLVGVLHDAFVKAFVDAGRWPPRDLDPLWGFALVLPALLGFGLVAPWLGPLAAIVLLTFTLSCAQRWLDDLSAIAAPVRRHAAVAPEGGVHSVPRQDDVWLAYRPLGDRSPGVEVLDRGLRRLLARGDLPPEQFEVRDAHGPWTPLTVCRTRPAAAPGVDFPFMPPRPRASEPRRDELGAISIAAAVPNFSATTQCGLVAAFVVPKN